MIIFHSYDTYLTSKILHNARKKRFYVVQIKTFTAVVFLLNSPAFHSSSISRKCILTVIPSVDS